MSEQTVTVIVGLPAYPESASDYIGKINYYYKNCEASKREPTRKITMKGGCAWLQKYRLLTEEEDDDGYPAALVFGVWEEGDYCYSYAPANFCPNCGARIVMEVVEEPGDNLALQQRDYDLQRQWLVDNPYRKREG